MQDIIFANFPELKPKPLVLDKWEDLGEINGCYIDSESYITLKGFVLCGI